LLNESWSTIVFFKNGDFMTFIFSLLLACSYKMREGQNAPVPLAPADYTIKDWKSEKHCDKYAFGIRFPIFEEVTYGFTPTETLIAIPDHTTATAVYKILYKEKNAATLAYPQYKTTFKGIRLIGIPLFGEKCVNVKARPVILKNGPYIPYEVISNSEE
jgi:hypothetical protein